MCLLLVVCVSCFWLVNLFDLGFVWLCVVCCCFILCLFRLPWLVLFWGLIVVWFAFRVLLLWRLVVDCLSWRYRFTLLMDYMWLGWLFKWGVFGGCLVTCLGGFTWVCGSYTLTIFGCVVDMLLDLFGLLVCCSLCLLLMLYLYLVCVAFNACGWAFMIACFVVHLLFGIWFVFGFTFWIGCFYCVCVYFDTGLA